MVIQEVFHDSLVAQDGRLQAGDQIVEVNGVDMTNASHKMVTIPGDGTYAVLVCGNIVQDIDKYD